MKKNRILGFVLAAVFAGFFCVQNVLAEEDEYADVTVKVDEIMSITLSDDEVETVIENKALNIMELTMFTETNNPTGAKVGVSVNTDYTELRNTDASFSENIPTISNPITDAADFPATGWGFSTDGMMLEFDGTYNRFRPLGKAVDNFYYNMQPWSGEDTVAFGVRADNLPAGDYTNEVIFTMVANPVLTAIPKAILGENGNLNFVYTNEDYIVGNYYYDNLGRTKILNVYAVPQEFGQVPWRANSRVSSVNIDDTFAYYYPTKTDYWFANLNLDSITNLDNLKMDNVRTSTGMFYSVYGTDSLKLDLRNWNTHSLYDMDEMFYYAKANNNIELILDDWDLSSIYTMLRAFVGFGFSTHDNVKLSAKNWDLKSLYELPGYFFQQAGYGCKNLEVDVPNWDFGSSRTSLNSVFRFDGGSETTRLDASGWNVSKVQNVRSLFYSPAKEIEASFANWRVDSFGNIAYLFSESTSNATVKATLDISGWNTKDHYNMTGLFQNSAWTTIYVSDDWSYESVTDPNTTLFSGCSSLVGGNGTTYDANNIGLDYARIDAPGAPGYFTLKTE